ncbi:MAG TPA: GDSL family lipase, partial [Verrucomicrobiales bacterium]|nr:GDSL family lipase [Verrucomicrobiales bacterium]
GDNDIANGKSPRQFMDEFRAFARLVHRRLPEARIYFVSIKPSPSREKLLPQMTEANRLVEAYCRKHSWLEYVDIVTPMLDTEGRPRGELFVSDRLHMNAEGYAIWADVIGRSLRAETEAAR